MDQNQKLSGSSVSEEKFFAFFNQAQDEYPEDAKMADDRLIDLLNQENQEKTE